MTLSELRRRELRGRTAIIAVGESKYYRRGQSDGDEHRLALTAILAACRDGNILPSEIDGMVSFGNDACDPARLAAALGLPELRYSGMQWGGGGGGVCGALAMAASAIVTGQARHVVMFRSLAQSESRRFGKAPGTAHVTGALAHVLPHGVMSPAQFFGLRIGRYMAEHRVRGEALRSIAMASYHHAQANPRAVMHGRPLDTATYDAARWIVGPLRLYDCCQESDGAAAIILSSAERAADGPHPTCLLLAAGMSAPYRSGAALHNAPDFATANFSLLGPRLFADAGTRPEDVDVLQSYENFTGGVMMSMVENGFCPPGQENEFFTLHRLTRGGELPINTSGGHLAEAYIHGMNLVVEAARQIQRRSCNQVDDANISMVTGGPFPAPVSGCILGSADTL